MIRTDETGQTYVWYIITGTDTKVTVSLEHYLAIAKTSPSLDERRIVFSKGTISPLTNADRDELGLTDPSLSIRAVAAGVGRRK